MTGQSFEETVLQRLLPTRDEIVQGYDGHIAVDASHQILVTHAL
jgi:hypothetical protein